jgi:CDP-paratose 2-epimerase
MKSILITGGAGFVGSSLALSIKTKYPEYNVLAFDNLKRRGSELNLPRFKSKDIKFVHGDVRNKEDFNELPEIDCLIEASAEPSVMAGINSSPDYLINTNLSGTVNCLNFASQRKCDLVFLSTSRVYSIDPLNHVSVDETDDRFEIAAGQDQPGVSEKGIAETFSTYGYRSLYGTSKLASELLIQEYNEFYKLRTVVNRCGVLAGAWQMGKVDQGVAVLWMARHFWKQPLTYNGYGGRGKQVRDILHISDLFSLVDYQMHNIEVVNNKTYNVGGGRNVSVSLKEMTAICERMTGNQLNIEKVGENRAADIRLYITDHSLVTKETGWKPSKSVEEIFEEIIAWIWNNQEQLKPILG